MGKFSEIAKIMQDLDNKYNHTQKVTENIKDVNSGEDALIKRLEEEYQKEHNENANIK